MRKQFFAFAVLLGLIGFVQAKPATAPEVEAKATRVALIDMADVFLKYKWFTDERARLRKELVAAEATGSAKKSHVQDLQTALKLKPAGSPEARKLSDQIVDAEAELKAHNQKVQVRFVAEESAVYKKVYLKVQKQVAETARHMGFTLVLRYNPASVKDASDPKTVISRMNRLVVVHDDAIDITKEVLTELNENYKDGQ